MPMASPSVWPTSIPGPVRAAFDKAEASMAYLRELHRVADAGIAELYQQLSVLHNEATMADMLRHGYADHITHRADN